MTDIDRRTFLTGLSAASAFTIVPRRVLGGQGFVAPSDMIRLAQVGCGLQSQRQVNTEFVRESLCGRTVRAIVHDDVAAFAVRDSGGGRTDTP